MLNVSKTKMLKTFKKYEVNNALFVKNFLTNMLNRGYNTRDIFEIKRYYIYYFNSSKSNNKMDLKNYSNKNFSCYGCVYFKQIEKFS